MKIAKCSFHLRLDREFTGQSVAIQNHKGENTTLNNSAEKKEGDAN